MKLLKFFQRKIDFVIDLQKSTGITTLAALCTPKVLFPLVIYSATAVLFGFSIVIEHRTFQECCEQFYPFITTVSNLIGLVIVVVLRKDIFQVINDNGDLIETSKYYWQISVNFARSLIFGNFHWPKSNDQCSINRKSRKVYDYNATSLF